MRSSASCHVPVTFLVPPLPNVQLPEKPLAPTDATVPLQIEPVATSFTCSDELSIVCPSAVTRSMRTATGREPVPVPITETSAAEAPFCCVIAPVKLSETEPGTRATAATAWCVAPPCGSAPTARVIAAPAAAATAAIPPSGSGATRFARIRHASAARTDATETT